MEVFRANLQLLEEQGLLSPDEPSFQGAAGQQHPAARSPPPNTSSSLPQRLSSPPKSIADPIHTNVHSPNITQPTQPDLNNTHPFTQMSQINNNNNINVVAMKAYGQLPIFNGGFPAEQHGVYPMLGAPMVQAAGGPVGQLAPGQHQLAATGLLFANPHQALRPALQIAQPQPPQPLLLTNKLKAQPSLISIPSPRDHKFMPY